MALRHIEDAAAPGDEPGILNRTRPEGGQPTARRGEKVGEAVGFEPAASLRAVGVGGGRRDLWVKVGDGGEQIQATVADEGDRAEVDHGGDGLALSEHVAGEGVEVDERRGVGLRQGGCQRGGVEVLLEDRVFEPTGAPEATGGVCLEVGVPGGATERAVADELAVLIAFRA